MTTFIQNFLPPFLRAQYTPVRTEETSLPLESLKERCSQIPSTLNFDRLQPIGSLSYRYVDEGLWENKIRRTPNISALAATKLQEAQAHAEEGRTLPSFDALCEREFERRHPAGFRLSGIKGWAEKYFSSFVKAVYGSATYFTEEARRMYKKQIAHSACNRDNLHSKIIITDPELKRALQIQNDATLTSVHTFSANSPLNGQSYKNAAGEVVLLNQAISSSSDKKSAATANLRRISTQEGRSIAYSGRVETKQKAEEQAAFIFFEELKSQGKGIRSIQTSEGETVYELDYAIHSVLSTPFFLKQGISSIVDFSERDCLETELKNLQELRARGAIALIHPETGEVYKVRCNPLVFADKLNCLLKLDSSLPSFATGSSYAALASHAGAEGLQGQSRKKIAALQEELSLIPSLEPERRQAVESQIHTLQRITALMVESQDLSAEERIFYRDYLCKLLDLPVVYHCKGSMDRTGILIALSTAIQQWIDLKLPFPDSPKDILQDFRFKELFAANLMTGHQITRYARSSEGAVNGEHLCPHHLGYRFAEGIFQNPLLHKLMPERYLTDYPLKYKIMAAPLLILGHLLLLPVLTIAVLSRLGLYLASAGSKEKYLTSWPHIFPFSITTSLLGSLNWIPTKILNEASPQVRGRSLLDKYPPSCPELHTGCFAREQDISGLGLLQQASSPEEYRRRFADLRKQGFQKTMVCAPVSSPLQKSFETLREKIRQKQEEDDIDYDFSQELAGIKEETCDCLQRDIERSLLNRKSRQLIINGKRFGISQELLQYPQKRKQEARNQTLEVYDILKAFYLRGSPELASSDRVLDLEEKILMVIDNLHQGGISNLLSPLIKEFQTQDFMLSTNNSYTLELQLDPHEILADGTQGSIVLKRRFLIDIVSEKAFELRPLATPAGHDENGMVLYNDKQCQGEGIVFAESIEEFSPSAELSVRLGIV